jgi:hypothetical protein
MLIDYLVDGVYYCRGGFQKLAENLVNGLIKHRGKIRYMSVVKKFSVINNQVQSVLLASGERIKNIYHGIERGFETNYQSIDRRGIFPEKICGAYQPDAALSFYFCRVYIN